MKFIDDVIEVKNLNYKTYIEDISFSIKRGDYVAIIGPNGGGKSTLIKLILGLIAPTSGKVKLFGKDRMNFKNNSKIGYVPQGVTKNDSSFPITVYEVIKLGFAHKSSLFSSINQKDREYIEFIMDKVDVTDLKSRLISQLSGGQRQRVMIARALISKPDILILDEPNTGVDTNSQKIFYDFLKELNQKDNITILFITHDLEVIVDDVTNVLCINRSLLSYKDKNAVLQCNTMSELYGIDAHVVHHNH